ncbi:MAG: class I SAM-dependent methyltransferase [candidate division FCPU426 bacterium]
MDRQIYHDLATAGSGYWWNQGRQHLVLGLIRKFSGRHLPDPGYRILDVGCAAGGTLSFLGAWGEAWGLDCSSEAIALCRTAGQPAERLVLGDATHLEPFEAETFDLVTAVEILEHLEEPETALASAWRVLKPGGLLILTVPADQRLWSERDQRLAHRRRYRIEELAQSVARAGFQVLKASYANAFYYWPYRWLLGWRRLLGREPVPRIRTNTYLPHPWLSALFAGLLRIETRLILIGRLPWGVSAVCAARKPAAAGAKP